MAFKDFPVHANSSGHCAQRSEVAAQLARALGADLAGLYAVPALCVSALMTVSGI